MRRVATIASVIVLFTLAVAKDKSSKDYPHIGTVTSFHSNNEVQGDEDSVSTIHRRVYVIKTDTGTIEVTGWEHGFKALKRPPLTVGQEIKYRTDGKYIWTVLDDGKEHRFYLMGASQ